MDFFNNNDNFNNKIKMFKKEVERLFSDLFESISLEELTGSFKANTPPIDIYTSHNKLVVEIEIPGALKEDIIIKIRDNILIIRWILKPRINNSNNNEDLRFLCMERRFGKFEKFMLLPFNPAMENVKAVLSNGVLRVIFDIKNKNVQSAIDVPICYANISEF